MIARFKARFKPWLQPISTAERLIVFVSLSIFSLVIALDWNGGPAPLAGAAVLAVLALWTIVRNWKRRGQWWLA